MASASIASAKAPHTAPIDVVPAPRLVLAAFCRKREQLADVPGIAVTSRFSDWSCHVNVLRDQRLHMAALLETGQGRMRGVRLCAIDATPACKTSGPVSLAHLVAIDEIPVLHGLSVFPVAVFIAIVGNTGASAASGAAQHSNIFAPAQELDELVYVTHTQKLKKSLRGRIL